MVKGTFSDIFRNHEGEIRSMLKKFLGLAFAAKRTAILSAYREAASTTPSM